MREILIFGGGSLGGAIARGLCNSKEKLIVTIVEKQAARRDLLKKETPWKIEESLSESVENKIVILAVKPQDATKVLNQTFSDAVLLISVMGGIIEKQIQKLTNNLNIVRAMPNLASEFGEGITALYSSNGANKDAETIFQVLGETVWLNDEKLIDLVTSISGTGMGVVSYLMQYVFDFAVQKGLTTEQAQKFIAMVLKGTGVVLQEKQELPKALADRVTSPNGTTAAALNVLVDNHSGETLARAFDAADKRAKELSRIN